MKTQAERELKEAEREWRDHLLECVRVLIYVGERFEHPEAGEWTRFSLHRIRAFKELAQGQGFSEEAINKVAYDNFGDGSRALNYFFCLKYLKHCGQLDLPEELRRKVLGLAYNGSTNLSVIYSLLHPAFRKDFFKFSLSYGKLVNANYVTGPLLERWKLQTDNNPQFLLQDKSYRDDWQAKLPELIKPSYQPGMDVKELNKKIRHDYVASGNCVGKYPNDPLIYFYQKECELLLVTYLVLGLGLQILLAIQVVRPAIFPPLAIEPPEEFYADPPEDASWFE